jgi:hypothetical protein
MEMNLQIQMLEILLEIDQERAKEAITSLSWISGYKSLTATRCNSWDDRELDALEGFKFIGFVLIQLLCTTMYINIAPQFDIWKAVDFLRDILHHHH